MEKYREIKWNKELEIEKERNIAKTQKEISRYDMNENPFKNSSIEILSIRQGMSGFKIVVLIALGILLASFIGCVASIAFTGAVLKGANEALNAKNPDYDKLVKSTTKDLEPLVKQVIPNTSEIKPLVKQNQIQIQPNRSEIVRKNSEKAVMQARAETQGFDSIYKKPAECYDTRNSAKRIKCANDYMRARAAFDLAQNK